MSEELISRLQQLSVAQRFYGHIAIELQMFSADPELRRALRIVGRRNAIHDDLLRRRLDELGGDSRSQAIDTIRETLESGLETAKRSDLSDLQKLELLFVPELARALRTSLTSDIKLALEGQDLITTLILQLVEAEEFDSWSIIEEQRLRLAAEQKEVPR